MAMFLMSCITALLIILQRYEFSAKVTTLHKSAETDNYFEEAFEGLPRPISEASGGLPFPFSRFHPCRGLQKSALQGIVRPKMQLNVSFFVTRISFLSFAKIDAL